MKIGGIELGIEPFIIAEAGLNHNGDLDRALEMVRIAHIAGCYAVKFQTFTASGVCSEDQVYTYRSQGKTITEPRINIFRRAELPVGAWPVIKRECERFGIIFLSTPQNPSDLDVLMGVGIPAIKIGSDDLTNIEMLKYCAKTRLPIILSTGMSNAVDIGNALAAIHPSEAVLMACTSEYPCPDESVNALKIRTLSWHNPLVGFSDHTKTSNAAIMAVALGACVFEKHFTLDHTLPGPDHWWSADTPELANYVNDIRSAHVMLGNGAIEPSAAELHNKAKYQRMVPA